MNLLKKTLTTYEVKQRVERIFFMTGDSIHISAEDLSSDGD